MSKFGYVVAFLATGGLAQAQSPTAVGKASVESGYYQTKWHTAAEMDAGEAAKAVVPKAAGQAKTAEVPAGATVLSSNAKLAEIPVIRSLVKRPPDIVLASAELPALPLPLPELLSADGSKPPKAWLQKPTSRNSALAVYPAVGRGPITATRQDGN